MGPRQGPLIKSLDREPQDHVAVALARPRIWPSRSTNFRASQILIRPPGPGRTVPRSDALMAWCAAGVIVIAIMAVNWPMAALFQR